MNSVNAGSRCAFLSVLSIAFCIAFDGAASANTNGSSIYEPGTFSTRLTIRSSPVFPKLGLRLGHWLLHEGASAPNAASGIALRIEPDQLAIIQYDGNGTDELSTAPVLSAQNKWYTLFVQFSGDDQVDVYRQGDGAETPGEPLTSLEGHSSVLAGLGGSAYAAGYTAGSDPEFEFAEFQYMPNTPLLGAQVVRFNDPFGRLFQEGMLDGEGNVTSYTTYAYDGWQVIQERDATTGNVAADYVHGPGYIDVVVRTTRGGTAYYHHTDAQFSTIALTNASGAVVERYGYDAFGAPTFYDGSGTSIPASAVDNNILYTGRTWDPYIGLYDYRTRMYDPATGRFTGRDSGNDPNNLGNPYAYLGNNPGSAMDPYGRFGIRIGDNGFNIGIGNPSLILGSDAWLGAGQGAAVLADTLLPGTPYRDAGYYSNGDPGIRAAQLAAGVGVGSAAVAFTGGVAAPGLVSLGVGEAGGVIAGSVAADIQAVTAATATTAATAGQRLLGKGKDALPMKYEGSLWKLPPTQRGNMIHWLLGATKLAPNFPVIDRFENGIATSIKSVNLAEQTYQNSQKLLNTLRGFVDKLAEFEGVQVGKNPITSTDILGRELIVAVPKNVMTAAQQSVFNGAVEYARSLGIRLIMMGFK